MLPSSTLGFLNVNTDGRRKDRHNREILFLLRLLRQAGLRDIGAHHVDDAGLNKDLPLTLAGKWYDIVYVAPDGEVFMLELMRVGTARGPATLEDGTPWQKRK